MAGRGKESPEGTCGSEGLIGLLRRATVADICDPDNACKLEHRLALLPLAPFAYHLSLFIPDPQTPPSTCPNECVSPVRLRDRASSTGAAPHSGFFRIPFCLPLTHTWNESFAIDSPGPLAQLERPLGSGSVHDQSPELAVRLPFPRFVLTALSHARTAPASVRLEYCSNVWLYEKKLCP